MTRNLSIVVPHFSKQESLKKVHEELKLQIHPKDEIVVIDDYSPDGVPKFDCLCTSVIRPPKQVPHTYRLNTLRNYGLQHAKWDACIVLDPDCIPNKYFLDKARAMYDPVVLFGGRIDKIGKDMGLKQDVRSIIGRSRWVDYPDGRLGGRMIYGGCMMFSKERTRLVGWFDTDFDGRWGAEEHEFASRCYHSGMRLRYSEELYVIHQWHPNTNREGYDYNRELWTQKASSHVKQLNLVSPYKPAIGVMVITMMRPDLIDQCLSAIFRNKIPLKVRLAVNGDVSKATLAAAARWKARWAVDVEIHDRKWPAAVRNDSIKWAKQQGFRHHIFLDDDMVVTSNGITNLVRIAEEHPEYYAISGCVKSSRGPNNRMLGGPMRDGNFYNYASVKDVLESDWVAGGFTIHRLDPLILFDDKYQTGYNDFDWSMTLKAKGQRLAVTGFAEAYHGYKLTPKGFVPYENSVEYRRIRHDSSRHARMRELFKSKWKFDIKEGGPWKG